MQGMIRTDSNAVLSVAHHHCCGLDVHKDKASAAAITAHEDKMIEGSICELGNFSEGQYRLKDLVCEQGCMWWRMTAWNAWCSSDDATFPSMAGYDRKDSITFFPISLG